MSMKWGVDYLADLRERDRANWPTPCESGPEPISLEAGVPLQEVDTEVDAPMAIGSVDGTIATDDEGRTPAKGPTVTPLLDSQIYRILRQAMVLGHGEASGSMSTGKVVHELRELCTCIKQLLAT